MLSRKNSFEQGNYLIKHSNLKPGHFGLIWLQNTLKHPLLFKMTEPALATLPKILIFNSNSWFIKLFLRDLDTFPCDQCIKSCAVLEILQQHIQTWIQSYQTTSATLQERVRISIYTKSGKALTQITLLKMASKRRRRFPSFRSHFSKAVKLN